MLPVLLAPDRRGRNTSARVGGVGGERADGDHEAHRVERRRAPDAVGEVAPDRRRAARACRCCRRPRPRGCRRRRGPAASGTAPHASANCVAAGVERDPAGQEARREPEVERAVHVAAPQRREELHVGKRGERGRGRTTASADSASDCRPSTTMRSPSRPSSALTAFSIEPSPDAVPSPASARELRRRSRRPRPARGAAPR